jgi:uncharacterized protein (TIGR00730 family)
MIRSICVFCGSASGSSPLYGEAAALLGREIAGRGLSLVYGGGNVGSMGVLAASAMEAGGRVTGIIPKKLNAVVEHLRLTELIVVEDMHERKALMQEKSDAFVALPGGIGTMEELFEVWTWRYIGYHRKPVGLLNIGVFYDGLLDFLRHMTAEGFLDGTILADLCVTDTQGEMLDLLEAKAFANVAPPMKLPELDPET